ncbi:hypothetical protein [Mycobacterium riyadhense]|uniref:Uncharacterized protein n=1 Tax=Mycobacterium riyadhense TaxID=486698 RepID=A0A1X2BIW1_9MYCO|nr:hypothetical protein [Mycobacterium riyadhense]ORW63542.1 hypothetical protein AWC22_00500 [Mycobacterium riyadhense]VTO96524.1 hypothetical protein BIN_B_01591 [Mycobacterium riyadhense]
MPTTIQSPLYHLARARNDLLDARMAALDAAHALAPGSRRNRATELAEKITDTLGFCERLQMAVTR